MRNWFFHLLSLLFLLYQEEFWGEALHSDSTSGKPDQQQPRIQQTTHSFIRQLYTSSVWESRERIKKDITVLLRILGTTHTSHTHLYIHTVPADSNNVSVRWSLHMQRKKTSGLVEIMHIGKNSLMENIHTSGVTFAS